jgi:hypothetical protein
LIERAYRAETVMSEMVMAGLLPGHFLRVEPIFWRRQSVFKKLTRSVFCL